MVTIPAAEWYFTDLVSENRQNAMANPPSFENIVSEIVTTGSIVDYRACQGDCGNVAGCIRPEFLIEVGEPLGDLFFNSRSELRTQYYKSPKFGDQQTKYALQELLPKLLGYASENPVKGLAL